MLPCGPPPSRREGRRTRHRLHLPRGQQGGRRARPSSSSPARSPRTFRTPAAPRGPAPPPPWRAADGPKGPEGGGGGGRAVLPAQPGLGRHRHHRRPGLYQRRGHGGPALWEHARPGAWPRGRAAQRRSRRRRFVLPGRQPQNSTDSTSIGPSSPSWSRRRRDFSVCMSVGSEVVISETTRPAPSRVSYPRV